MSAPRLSWTKVRLNWSLRSMQVTVAIQPAAEFAKQDAEKQAEQIAAVNGDVKAAVAEKMKELAEARSAMTSATKTLPSKKEALEISKRQGDWVNDQCGPARQYIRALAGPCPGACPTLCRRPSTSLHTSSRASGRAPRPAAYGLSPKSTWAFAPSFWGLRA